MRAALLSITALVVGCGGPGATPMMPSPDGGMGTLSLDSAAAKFPDLPTFWSRSIQRTCGPNNGVCHNNQQFPDMQTVSGLLAAINQRCNQIVSDPTAIDNLCEPRGDLLQVGADAQPFQAAIETVTPEPSATAPTSMVLLLHDPVPAGADESALAVVRQVAGLPPVTFSIPSGFTIQGNLVTLDLQTLAQLPGPTPYSSTGEKRTLADFFLPASYVPGDETQVEVGDPNGDGVFGFDLGGRLIKPGDPMNSYLFRRVLGPLALGDPITNVKGDPTISHPQMPIANFTHWDIDNSLVALWCWISGMKPDGSNADGPIDYDHCDLSQMPMPAHSGGSYAATFSSVYGQILQPSCAMPCHHTNTQVGTTFHMDDLQSTYDTLLGIGSPRPAPSESESLPFVTPGVPSQSYLYLKISATASMPPPAGSAMPPTGRLDPKAIQSISDWITQGAQND